MRVIIVEDDVIVALDLEETLLRAGHEIVGNTGSARTALDLARRRGADLALVDISLQDGAEAGLWLARRLAEELAIPSIFISGQRAQAHRAKEAALGYLPKPYSSEELAAAVELADAILRGRRHDRAAVLRRLELFEHDRWWGGTS